MDYKKYDVRSRELKYYGINATLALWKKRPDDIIRVYLTKDNISLYSSLLKWCAQNKRSYHIVEEEELFKITDSSHHEGVCILAKEKGAFPFDEISKNEQCLLYLDKVTNPHNIGSILRTCSHFGINHILGEKDKLPTLTPSACRVANGGAEFVQISYLKKNELLYFKKNGFTFVSTDSNDKRAVPLYDYQFPNKTLIILGSEEIGVSDHLLKESKIILKIPGSDKIESLNVSVATAILLSEFWRQKNRS